MKNPSALDEQLVTSSTNNVLEQLSKYDKQSYVLE